jgi:formylmethanofuran dehydrogenase subunit E
MKINLLMKIECKHCGEVVVEYDMSSLNEKALDMTTKDFSMENFKELLK